MRLSPPVRVGATAKEENGHRASPPRNYLNGGKAMEAHAAFACMLTEAIGGLTLDDDMVHEHDDHEQREELLLWLFEGDTSGEPAAFGGSQTFRAERQSTKARQCTISAPGRMNVPRQNSAIGSATASI